MQLSPGKPRQQEFVGQSLKEEEAAQRENPRDLQKVIEHACEKTTTGSGKKHPKGLELIVSGTHTRLGKVLVLSSYCVKTPKSQRVLDYSYLWKVLPQ